MVTPGTDTAVVNRTGGNIFAAVGADGTYTIEQGITLNATGSMNIRNSNSAIVINNGVINANGTTLSLTTASFSNATGGTLNASAGSLSITPTNFDNTGSLVVMLGRRGHPDEIASAVVWLAGPGGRFMTGQTLHINGGAYLGS